jgi:hypothetical protein
MNSIQQFILMICLLIASTSSAATYYVATTGNDANPGTLSLPFRSVHRGISTLYAGDTLLVRGGTYNEPADVFPRSGTSAYPITMQAYGTEKVIFKTMIIQFSNVHYWIVDGITFDGTGLWLGNGSSHNTFRNMEIMNSPSHGILESANGGPLGYNKFINLKIHDTGSNYYDNALYMNGSNNLYEGIEIYHTCGTAMQIYNSSGGSVDNNIIRNNFVHDTSGKWMATYRPQCITNSGGNSDVGKGQGILVRGSNNKIYNNIVANIDSSLRPCGIGCGGIMVYDWGSSNLVYNNTVTGIVAASAIQISSGASNSRVINNIAYGNTTNIQNDSGSTILSHNLTTQPLFMNPAQLDFHLQATSSAINAGTTLTEVQLDFDGVTRPQGGAYDIGAYEFSYGGTATPTPTPTPTPLPSSSDTIAPTVAITSPADGAIVARKSTLTIQANAFDNVFVREVRFYVDGLLQCTDQSAPYSCAWRVPASNGRDYFIEAQGIDSSANASPRVKITVRGQ